MRATPSNMDQWMKDAGQIYHDRCLEYFGPNGTVYRANPYLYDYGIPNEAKQIEGQKHCFDNFMNNAIENKNILRNEANYSSHTVAGSLVLPHSTDSPRTSD
jgi:hypothetical protein